MSSADVAPSGATFGYIKFCTAKRTMATAQLTNIHLFNSLSPVIEGTLWDGMYVNASAVEAGTLQRCILKWTADAEL